MKGFVIWLVKNNAPLPAPVSSTAKSQKEAPGEARAGCHWVPSSSQIAFGSSADAERSLHANKGFDIHSRAVNDLLVPQHLCGKQDLWIPVGFSPSP